MDLKKMYKYLFSQFLYYLFFKKRNSFITSIENCKLKLVKMKNDESVNKFSSSGLLWICLKITPIKLDVWRK